MTEPKESQDRLQDARLAQALKHMPDAHMQPSSHTRSAILQEAARAVNANTANTRRHGWPAWLGSTGSRTPWQAAFASVVLAFFVTTLWYEQDLPDVALKEAAVAQREEKIEPALPRANSPSAAVVQRKQLSESAVAQTMPAAPAAAPAPALVAVAPAAPPVVAMAASPAAADAPVAAKSAAQGYALEQSSRSSLSARASAGAVSAFAVTISQGTLVRNVSPQEAQPLLAMLRSLSYVATTASPLSAQPSGDLLVVEISGQERWVIGGNQVGREKLGARIPNAASPLTSAATPTSLSQADATSQANTPSVAELGVITPAQYAELRRLALDIARAAP